MKQKNKNKNLYFYTIELTHCELENLIYKLYKLNSGESAVQFAGY